MAKPSVDLVMLNAYVDGELDVVEAARIDDIAMHNPEVARQLATLSALKAATAQASLPRRLKAAPQRSERWKGVMMAASLAFLLLSATVGGYVFWESDTTSDSTGFARAAHASWAGETDRAIANVELVLAASSTTIPNAYIPDLTAAKLTLVHLEVWREPDGSSLVVGYLGTRGCRITLTIKRTGHSATQDSRTEQAAGLLVRRWSVSGLSYALIANGMAPKRFESIAQSVQDGSQRHVPFDTETRTALAHARASSPPCAVG